MLYKTSLTVRYIEGSNGCFYGRDYKEPNRQTKILPSQPDLFSPQDSGENHISVNEKQTVSHCFIKFASHLLQIFFNLWLIILDLVIKSIVIEDCSYLILDFSKKPNVKNELPILKRHIGMLVFAIVVRKAKIYLPFKYQNIFLPN